MSSVEVCFIMKNYLLKQSFQSLFYPLLFVGLMWFVFLLQNTSDFNFLNLGVLPREAKGLLGIVTSVFVHGDLGHIASNTLPLLALGMMLFYFYKKIAKAAFLWVWIVSGIWLWIGGGSNPDHPTYHIGASTLIYGLATFMFFSGVFRKHLRLMVVSALVVFLYGSIMWGIFPLKAGISWEGHLFGALAGVLVAFNYRKEGPKPKVYEWPEEEEEEEGPQAWQQTGPEGAPLDQPPATNMTITYVYKEKDKEL